MTYTFEIHPQALKRRFSVYVVVAQGDEETLLYVGKTGDNREGCNPLNQKNAPFGNGDFPPR